MAVNADFVSRGYLIVDTAKKLGCKTFVHISFPRHMSYETLGRRRAIMEAACKDLGIQFVFETAPDPTSDVGVAGAQQFILEKTPAWVAKYGKDTAFFCTNDAHTEPLLKQLAKHGGYFIEADLRRRSWATPEPSASTSRRKPATGQPSSRRLRRQSATPEQRAAWEHGPTPTE